MLAQAASDPPGVSIDRRDIARLAAKRPPAAGCAHAAHGLRPAFARSPFDRLAESGPTTNAGRVPAPRRCGHGFRVSFRLLATAARLSRHSQQPRISCDRYSDLSGRNQGPASNRARADSADREEHKPHGHSDDCCNRDDHDRDFERGGSAILQAIVRLGHASAPGSHRLWHPVVRCGS